MNDAPPHTRSDTVRCPRCGQRLEPFDRFCRFCGRKQAAESAKWYYEPVVVLLMVFLVLGAFAIPLILRSPKFTPAAKVTLSIISVIYTVALVAATLWIVWVMFSHFSDLRNIQHLI